MNDAQCDKHLIQWSTEERGEECPACILEQALQNIIDGINRDIKLLEDAQKAIESAAHIA
ncbi:MAG: hypothetical protein ACOY4M_08245 [Pseudomonadota bacterium]